MRAQLNRRMLFENICDSKKLASISPRAENLYYRLYTKLDDFGDWYAAPARIRVSCFPVELASKWTNRMVENWRNELVSVGLVTLYTVEGQQYIHFNDFEQFQKIPGKPRAWVPIYTSANPRAGVKTPTQTPGLVQPDQPTPGGDDVTSCGISETGSQPNRTEPNRRGSAHSEQKKTPFNPLSWSEPIDGFSSAQVRNAILFARDEDPKQFFWKKLTSEANLRKHIATMVQQAGDYEPPVPCPKKRADPSCPICEGDGVDYDRYTRTCSCVRFFAGDTGEEIDHFLFESLVGAKTGTERPGCSRDEFVSKLAASDEKLAVERATSQPYGSL